MTLPDRRELASGDQTKLMETPSEPVEPGMPSGAASSLSEDANPVSLPAQVEQVKPAPTNEAAGTTPAKTDNSSKVGIVDSTSSWLCWVVKPKVLIALMVVAAAYWAVSFFAHRFQTEALMHEYLDRAQMQDMHDNLVLSADPTGVQSNPYWKTAMRLAQSLGEDNNTLADLYIKSANNERDRRTKQTYLEKALALYESSPNTVTAQLTTLEELIRAHSPTLFDRSGHASPPFDSPRSAQDAVRRKDFKRAILEYNSFLDDPMWRYDSIATIGTTFNDGLDQIAMGLQSGDPLLVKALPLFHRCVFLHSEDLKVMADQYKNLETVIRKSGKNPDDYKDRRDLAFQALRQQDYFGAYVELHWCLGHSDDPSLRNELRRTNMSIARLKRRDSLVDAQQCVKLLQKLRQLLVPRFGLQNFHVLDTDLALADTYISLGQVDEGEQLIREVLDISARAADVDNRSGKVYALGAFYPGVFNLLFEALLSDAQFKQALALSATMKNLPALGVESATSKPYHFIVLSFDSGHRDEAETALKKLEKDHDTTAIRVR